MSNQANVVVANDSQQLRQIVVDRWLQAAQAAIAQHGSFHVALAGGNTPRAIYTRLAEDNRLTALWKNTHLYFGDERCVPPEHPDSNYLMVKQSLLDNISLPASQCHRIEAEHAPEQAAQDYARVLANSLPKNDEGHLQFDLVLLGMGTDGHTASLFPGTAALHDTEHDVIANHVPQLDCWRITLGLRIINQAQQILILVTGREKASVLKDIFSFREKRYPVNSLCPRGKLDWLVDRDAATLLE